MVAAMPAQEVTKEIRDDVALIGWHRPEENYFDATLIGSIADALDEAASDRNLRCAVLYSEGKHFCAGAHFGAPRDLSENPWPLYEAGLRLFHSSLPIVAAVQGAAVGGGLGLALAADFRVATPLTRFHANFARIGFHQGFGISVTLPAVVGRQRAIEMLYRAEPVRGERAVEIGLADRLVAPEVLVDEAIAFARSIGAHAPLALRSIRETMRAGFVEQVRDAMRHEARVQTELANTRDFAEGVAAGAERRVARFEGC